MAVTKVPFVSQCAETQRIALGLGIPFATFLNPVTNSFSSMAFIGLPWPRNNTGILSVLRKVDVILFSSFSFIEAAKGVIAMDFRNCFLFIILPFALKGKVMMKHHDTGDSSWSSVWPNRCLVLALAVWSVTNFVFSKYPLTVCLRMRKKADIRPNC